MLTSLIFEMAKQSKKKGKRMKPPLYLVDGYIAVWKRYPTNEIKIRVARPSVLSPSQILLDDWNRGKKTGKMTWNDYENRFTKEILSNPKAIAKLEEIRKLSETQVVRLMCFEKNPPCHRFTLIRWLREGFGV